MEYNELFDEIVESVLDGNSKAVVAKVNEAVAAGVPAGRILNEALIAGMGEVGVLFKEGEMFVPEVLVSAKAMQNGVDIVKPLLVAGDVKKLGTILTVTVAGDLHDIGVKLVGMMLEGAGFEVIYMGVDKSTAEIIEKVKEVRPNILGMSAMLTTTMANMKEVIETLREEGIFGDVGVMIGGAPTSISYAEQIGARYSADASDAVRVAKELLSIA